MNKKECNCCCCCCENNNNNWNWGQEHHSCCQCCKEKATSQCDCWGSKLQSQNYDCGCDNKYKNQSFCDCGKSNYGYEKYNQSGFGWY